MRRSKSGNLLCGNIPVVQAQGILGKSCIPWKRRQSSKNMAVLIAYEQDDLHGTVTYVGARERVIHDDCALRQRSCAGRDPHTVYAPVLYRSEMDGERASYYFFPVAGTSVCTMGKS